MMRLLSLFAASLVALVLASPALAHPLGIPPLAEIVVAGDRARTTLTVALDDTLILMEKVEVPGEDFDRLGADALARQPEVADYLTSTYSLETGAGMCEATVAGGTHIGSGFRFLIDHTCPEPLGDAFTIRTTFLRDISEQYRFVAVARSPGKQARATFEPGETEERVELTAVPVAAEGEEPGAEEGEGGSREAGLARLFTFLDAGQGLGAALAAFAVAAALGALHGLTPGHGKTLVAAYLAGSDAKVRHAFAVGAALTFTHTIAVLAFGVLALVAGEAFLPQNVEPVLAGVAAGVVILLGLYLLVKRVRLLRSGGDVLHVHSHEHAAERAMSGRGIVAVGLAGGIVPCPEAFGLLFVALSLGKVLAGLMLLVSFSLGLAAVLVAVSIGLVLSRKAIAPRLERSRVVRFLPVVSAVVVTGIGVALAVGAARAF